MANSTIHLLNNVRPKLTFANRLNRIGWPAQKLFSSSSIRRCGVSMPLAERAIDSVLELRAVFARLDGLSAEQRAALFANAAEMPSDFSLIVNHAWLSEHRQGIDWVRCAQLYLGMAKQAQHWGYRQLALRCYIARGVMLDEYATDPEGALTALNEAEESLGPDPALSRARAKIYYRRKDHAAALALLRDSADKAARNDFIEQARNPQRNVVVHYLSTSPIGQERAVDDPAAGKPTLEYWRSAAAAADVAPLRKVLLGAGLSEKVESFINARDDQDLRDDFLKRMQWDCAQPDLRAVQEILAARLDRYCSEELELYADDGEHLVGNILMHVLDTIVHAKPRCLDAYGLRKLLENSTTVRVPRNAANAILRQAAGGLGRLRGGRRMIEVIYADRCTSCDICVNVCPTNVFDKTDGIPVIARQYDCQTCFLCELYCPEDALCVSRFADETQPIDVIALQRTVAMGSYRRAVGWTDDTRDRRGVDCSYLLFGH